MDSNDVENNIIKKGHIFRVIWPRLTDPGGPKWAYEGFFWCFSLKWTEIFLRALIALKIDHVSSLKSKMGSYTKIGPFLAKKWRIDGDQK